MGPNLLLTNDPDIIRHMNLAGSRWRRAGWYEGMKLDPKIDTVFSTTDENKHAELRKLEIGGYNGRDIDTLEPDIDAKVVEVMELIKTKYNGKVMDVARILRFFALDCISTIAFGEPFGFMAKDEDFWDYSNTLEDFMTVLILNNNHAFVRWLFFSRPVQWLARPRPTDKTGFGPALEFARRATAKRFGPDAKVRSDMLGHFVGKGLGQTQCEAESFLQIVAGADPPATVARCALFSLVGNATAYCKLRAEIDQAVNSGRVSHPVITYSEAQKLPYLNACIWEALRMFPPLFRMKSKIAPSGGEQIKDYYFPEGTELGSCDYAFVKSKDIFGEDADIFRPGRWVQASEEDRKRYRYTVDTIFGSGRLQCLGRHIAFIELHKILFELVRNFDWALADPMKGVNSVATSVLSQSDMNMVAWSRDQ